MKPIRQFIHWVEQGFDRLNTSFRKRNGYEKRVHIIAYHGFGNDREMIVQGRVIKDRGVLPGHRDDTVFRNIKRTYKHFASKELPGVTVQAEYQQQQLTSITNEEGYFTFHIPFSSPQSRDELWHTVALSLPEMAHVKAEAQVQIPLPETSFGVISDIDDTILQTGVSSMVKTITVTFTKNADTRLSFPGVDVLYRGFQHGTAARAINPIYYLSNSPWNLFDFLKDFLKLKDIPKGTILLRDWGVDRHKLGADSGHKLHMMRTLFTTCSDLAFILIGDSGEKDPEYYEQITEEFPGRVLAIYIRNVTFGKRDEEVHAIAKRVSERGVPMLLMENTIDAARHAAEHRWVTPEVAEKVRIQL